MDYCRIQDNESKEGKGLTHIHRGEYHPLIRVSVSGWLGADLSWSWLDPITWRIYKETSTGTGDSILECIVPNLRDHVPRFRVHLA